MKTGEDEWSMNKLWNLWSFIEKVAVTLHTFSKKGKLSKNRYKMEYKRSSENL